MVRIAIISNTNYLIPLAYTLAAQKLQVCLFYSPSADVFINQKVLAIASQLQLNYREEKNPDTDLYQWLNQGKFDACFVMGYGKLIKLDKITCATPLFNIHFGLLPAYKGPIPAFWQLKHGLSKLTVAIHRINQKFDEGAVVWQKQIDNLPHFNFHTASQALGQVCVEGAFYLLQMLASKQNIQVVNTAGIKAAYQKRPTLADVSIHWEQQSAIEICNLIRACNPWNKGAITMFKGNEIKLLDAQWIDSEANGQYPAGTIIANGQSLTIACIGNKLISVNMLYLNESFVPAYQATVWGIKAGERLG